MAEGLTLRERRDRIVAAREAMAGLDGELWSADGAALAEVMGEADALVVAAESARVIVAREAMDRGEPGSGAPALTPAQWVRRHAPSTRVGGSARVVALAEAFSVSGNAPVKEAVLSGELPVRSAAVVVAEADRLRPHLAEGAESAVLDGLIRMAVEHGPRGCRMLRPRLLAQYGLDGEGRATLEAALGPLSAPKPVEGERDLRSSDRRRGEALVQLVRRAVSAGDAMPKNPKSQLFVTVDIETLRS